MKIIKNGKTVIMKNTIMLYIMTATKYILPFIVTACLTRRLGKDNYGTVTYINAIMNYFLMFFDFGFNYSATKKISQNRDNSNIVQDIISKVYTSKILLAVLGIFILGIIVLFVPILRENLLLVFFYYLSTAANIFIFDFLYRGLEKMEFVTIRYVISRLISTILIFIFVNSPKNMLFIPIFYLIGTVVAAIITFKHVRNKLNYKISILTFKVIINELKESFIYFASTIASSVLSAFNTIILGFTNFTPAEVAYWGVALQVVTAVNALYEPITSSVYPYVAVKKDYKFVIKTTSILFVFVIIGSILLYFCSGFVIKILAGSGYEKSVDILRILLLVIIFAFPAQMFGFPLLGAMGNQKFVTMSTVITAVTHIVMTFVLIISGNFTLISMAILRGFSEFLLFILRLIFFKHCIKNQIGDK